MLKIKLLKRATDFLDILPAKQFKQIVSKVIGLASNPHPHDSKKLNGYDFLRTDIGEYRIIYTVNNDCVEIILIGNRNDGAVYQLLKRSQR